MKPKTEDAAESGIGSTELLGWETVACDVSSFVFSTTRGRAMAATLRSARDAGYRIKFPDVKCRRRPEIDGLDMGRKVQPNRPYCPDFILS